MVSCHCVPLELGKPPTSCDAKFTPSHWSSGNPRHPATRNSQAGTGARLVSCRCVALELGKPPTSCGAEFTSWHWSRIGLLPLSRTGSQASRPFSWERLRTRAQTPSAGLPTTVPEGISHHHERPPEKGKRGLIHISSLHPYTHRSGRQ